ncbi:MAG TPA: hypothetical protein VGE06_07045 [Flavisolibacter sp.]
MLTQIRSERRGSRVMLFLLAAAGAVLWIMSGVALAVAPAGNPPYSFRVPVMDVRFPLSFGLLLISTSLGLSLLSVVTVSTRRFRIIQMMIFLSGGLHFSGRLVRDAFLQNVGWEPLLPFGFLLFIGSLFTMGIFALRKKAVAPVTGVLMIVTALLLLFFNDQYLPFMAVPFGFAVIALSAILNFLRK